MTATAPSPFHQFAAGVWNDLFPAPSPTHDADLLHELVFVPQLKELLLLRQVHALEHATVWILGGTPRSTAYRSITQDDEHLSGLSTAEGFYLFGKVETSTLNQAVHRALHRLVSGEWHLAVHPRCGTNLAVNLTLSAGMAMGSHFILPKDPISQFFGLGAAITIASQLSPTIGSWVQSHITTAIPFNLRIQQVRPIEQENGKVAHFVSLEWREIN